MCWAGIYLMLKDALGVVTIHLDGVVGLNSQHPFAPADLPAAAFSGTNETRYYP
jgi:hypothetical protein